MVLFLSTGGKDWPEVGSEGRGEKGKKVVWEPARREQGGKEDRKPGRDGKRPASQPVCVCAPRSVRERKETERPFPSGLAGLTTEELILWARLGTAGTGGDDHAGPLRDQTRTGRARFASPEILNE